MPLQIESAVLEDACKNMIETILFSLRNAFRGTIYRVGRSPDLITQRITSGLIDQKRSEISWGIHERPDEYNPPGRPWVAYRDEPSRPLEAMAWCVEKQKSWTSEDPMRDPRSVRLQVEGGYENSHHMEPVLVRKTDLLLDMYSSFEYAKDYDGNPIWEDSDYIVVAVVKIHFKPLTVQIGSPETMAIKKLSRSLGTELLSYHLHRNSMMARQQLAKDRLNACNILADSLRNTIAKAAIAFSLVKQEIGYMRHQWVQVLLEARNEKNPKVVAIEELNLILAGMSEQAHDFGADLIAVNGRLLELHLTPEKAENWVVRQIEERWKQLLQRYPQGDEKERTIWRTIDRLKKSLYFGRDPEILSGYGKVPDEVKREWVSLLYSNSDHFDGSHVERLINMLSNPDVDIPSRERSRKRLIQLKALAETIGQLEQNTNFMLREVLKGGENGFNGNC